MLQKQRSPRRCSLMKNEAKMKEVRKAVTNYDTSDQKECKFFIWLRFHKVEKREGRSSTIRFSFANETRVFLLCSRRLLALTVRGKPLPARRTNRCAQSQRAVLQQVNRLPTLRANHTRGRRQNWVLKKSGFPWRGWGVTGNGRSGYI